MNATEVIEDARRWADLHRANAYQREGVKRVDDLLALAEEQAAAIDRVRALHEPHTIQAITGDCAAEECEHEEIRDCSSVAFKQCVECGRIADEAYTYYAESGMGFTSWPCPTIAALNGDQP